MANKRRFPTASPRPVLPPRRTVGIPQIMSGLAVIWYIKKGVVEGLGDVTTGVDFDRRSEIEFDDVRKRATATEFRDCEPVFDPIALDNRL